VIARIWKGITRQEDRDAYWEYLNKTGLPEYRSVRGNRGVFVLCRVFEGKAEFTLISFMGVLGSDQTVCRPGVRKGGLLSRRPKVSAGTGAARDPLRGYCLSRLSWQVSPYSSLQI
jgi:hypothetical protein